MTKKKKKKKLLGFKCFSAQYKRDFCFGPYFSSNQQQCVSVVNTVIETKLSMNHWSLAMPFFFRFNGSASNADIQFHDTQQQRLRGSSSSKPFVFESYFRPKSANLPGRVDCPAAGDGVVPLATVSSRFDNNIAGIQWSYNFRFLLFAPTSNVVDFVYSMPLKGKTRVTQGNGGTFSHNTPEGQHAYDFSVCNIFS